MSVDQSIPSSTSHGALRACPHCGEGVAPAGAFCSHCGQRIDPAHLATPVSRLLLVVIMLINLGLLAGTAFFCYQLYAGREQAPAVELRVGVPRAVSPAGAASDAAAGQGGINTGAAAATAIATARAPSRAATTAARRVGGGAIRSAPPGRTAASPRGSGSRDGTAAPDATVAVAASGARGDSAAAVAVADAGASPPSVAATEPSSAQPAVQPADPGANAAEQLDAESVSMVVRRHLPQVQACYDRWLKGGSSVQGTVEIHFGVGAAGTVTFAEPQRNTTGHEGLAKCIAHAVRGWRFPRPASGDAQFIFPFVFAAND